MFKLNKKSFAIIFLMSLLFTSVNAEALFAPRSPNPYECNRTLLNGRKCAPWSSLYQVVDTIKDRPGVVKRPYRWYSVRGHVTKIVLHGIRFDFDQYSIRPESYPILEANMSQLTDKGQVEIHVTGHTDSVGSDAYNQILSLQRAQSVLDYFVSKGLRVGRVSVSGDGETQPADTNETAAGRFNNRRIEITITHQQMAQL
ncbi:MAG: OmpA family protein [Deltaproteobacteria bacterium]|nr:OmpA family protein [Deltaproteobacteria bacterium]